MSLQEGTPNGVIRLANRNRRGIAYKIPRNRLGFLKRLQGEQDRQMREGKLPDDTCIGKGCVYILFGRTTDEADERFEEEDKYKEGIAYIGKSMNIQSRLSNHDTKKDYWNEVVVLCRTDHDFNDGHVLYVEGQLIDIAKRCDRFTIKNDPRQENNEKTISSDDRPVADDFIDDIKILVEMLGYKIFSPKREGAAVQSSVQLETCDAVPIFYIITRDGIEAKGQPTNDGFVVFAGSDVSPMEADRCPERIKELRNSLKVAGIISDNKFTRDMIFKKPSPAACVIYGGSVSGNAAWSLPLDSDVSPRDCKRWLELGDWQEEKGILNQEIDFDESAMMQGNSDACATSEEQQALTEDKAKRRGNCKFSMLKISAGEELVYAADETKTCRVVDDGNKVEYDGNTYTLSGLATQIRKDAGYETNGVQGTIYFRYKGELLSELRDRMEREQAKKQANRQ